MDAAEAAALAYDFRGVWARPKQVPPPGPWQSWGFLGGRGFGKTISVASFVNDEVEAGRAPLVALLAQDEQSAIDLQVNGPSGLIATAHPSVRPEWQATARQLLWPNGSVAYVRTPEVPGKIRGLEYYLSWICEVQSWPAATREEAYANVVLSTRLGQARIVWDATPKRRHPILTALRAQGLADPERHVVVHGTTHENAANLGDGYVDNLVQMFGGTARGREEIDGVMLEDAEAAIVQASWIKRRQAPSGFMYRVVSIDPAVTNRRGSDTTGIIDFGLATDGEGCVLGDWSGKMDVGAWADLVLDIYVNNGCDLVLAETNKGGQLVVQNLRAAAAARHLTVVVVGKDEKPRRLAGTVYVKEVYARGAKEDRAEPVGTAYQRGRIAHVDGVDLSSLEDTITTWEPTPGADSPGDLDALVHAAVEVLGLSVNGPDAKQAFRGLSDFGKALLRPPTRAGVPSALALLASLGGRADRL